jgi:hypothetical protein
MTTSSQSELNNPRRFTKARDCALEFVARHRFAIAYGVMVVSFLFLFPARNATMQGDVRLYQGVANDLFEGKLPYRDRVVEYPPYGLPIFILPRLFGDANYLEAFMGLALVADWSVKLLLFGFGLRFLNGARSLLPLLLYCATVPFMRYFFLQRYDVFPALICLAAVWLFCSRRFALSGLAIAAGVGVKLYPVTFVPVLFVLAVRQGGGRRFLIGLMAGLLPLVPLSFIVPWWRFAEFHAARGLQVESLYASLLWLGQLLGLTPATWEYTQKWYEVLGPPATAVLPWARAIFVLAVIFSTAFSVWMVARNQEPSPAQLARCLLVPLLGFVAFNQVLSPQYLIWLLPLAALSSFDGKNWPALAIVGATMLTPIIFPSLTRNYPSGLNLVETMILVVRNLGLLSVWAWIICQSATGQRRLNPQHPKTLSY